MDKIYIYIYIYYSVVKSNELAKAMADRYIFQLRTVAKEDMEIKI